MSLNLVTGIADVNGEPVNLSPRETGVLEALMLRPNEALDRESLVRHLYDSASHEVDPRIVDVFVCILSRKLRNAGAPDLIETVMGQGYMIAWAP